MAELMTTLADQIAAPADAPSAALRIGTITAIEVGGSGRVQTDSTLGAWLSRDADSGQVRRDSMDDYRAIEPNAIADTFNELTKEQVARKMGGLGK